MPRAPQPPPDNEIDISLDDGDASDAGDRPTTPSVRSADLAELAALKRTPVPSAPSRFRTGWKRDKHDPRDRPAHAMLGAPRNLPGEVTNIEPHFRGILDQGQTERCTAYAFAEAVDTRLRFKGFNPPEPSKGALYAATKGLEKGNPNDPIVDDGAYPRDAARALSSYGLVPEADWSSAEDRVADQPPWDVAQEASTFRVAAYYRVMSQGVSKLDEIANALAKGFPVVFGANVGDAFQGYAGDPAGVEFVPVNAPGSVGHMLCLLGFTQRNGDRLFRGPNSWGRGWGSNGWFWVPSGQLVDDSITGDYYVLEVAGG